MNLEQVKQDIEKWIENFVEVPHPALGNWPPCPYARRARLQQTYSVKLGIDPLKDLIDLSNQGLGDREVIIFAYDKIIWSAATIAQAVIAGNEYCLPKDIIALEDHPEDPEIVNGLCFNQGSYALILTQSLSKLNEAAQAIARQGFYTNWPENYLQMLFKHRQDPRL